MYKVMWRDAQGSSIYSRKPEAASMSISRSLPSQINQVPPAHGLLEPISRGDHQVKRCKSESGVQNRRPFLQVHKQAQHACMRTDSGRKCTDDICRHPTLIPIMTSARGGNRGGPWGPFSFPKLLFCLISFPSNNEFMYYLSD